MAKTVDDYLKLPYTLELIPDPDSGFAAAVKELPGCISQGDTAEEALEMIRDAMRLWIETAIGDGLPVPEPRLQESYSGKFVVRVPSSLHHRLVDAAEAEGVSLNQYINVALASAISGEKPKTSAQTDESGEMVSWPGLNTAIVGVLRHAGYSQQAGEIDEHLFADWLGEMLSNIDGAVESEDYSEAQRYLTRTSTILQQNVERGPMIDLLIEILGCQRRMVERVNRLQQAFIRQAVQPQLQDRIRVVYQQQYEPSETLRERHLTLKEDNQAIMFSEKSQSIEDLRKLLGNSKDE